MDGQTNTRIADGIAAELRDIDDNHPEYSLAGRAFVAGCERGFRRLSEEKGGYPVDGSQEPAAAASAGSATGGVAPIEPENAVVAEPSGCSTTTKS